METEHDIDLVVCIAAAQRRGMLDANEAERQGKDANNIAEGFERGTTNELLAFLYIARGSAGEVRSMLCLLERRRAFGHLKSQISNLKST
jgi:hypothetical protein